MPLIYPHFLRLQKTVTKNQPKSPRHLVVVSPRYGRCGSPTCKRTHSVLKKPVSDVEDAEEEEAEVEEKPKKRAAPRKKPESKAKPEPKAKPESKAKAQTKKAESKTKTKAAPKKAAKKVSSASIKFRPTY